MLNSAYSLPNIILPFIYGWLTDAIFGFRFFFLVFSFNIFIDNGGTFKNWWHYRGWMYFFGSTSLGWWFSLNTKWHRILFGHARKRHHWTGRSRFDCHSFWLSIEMVSIERIVPGFCSGNEWHENCEYPFAPIHCDPDFFFRQVPLRFMLLPGSMIILPCLPPCGSAVSFV